MLPQPVGVAVFHDYADPGLVATIPQQECSHRGQPCPQQTAVWAGQRTWTGRRIDGAPNVLVMDEVLQRVGLRIDTWQGKR